MDEITSVFIWLLVIESTGFLALPIASYLCRWLPDRGYTVSKLLGILLITYFTWLPPSLHLLRFGQISIAIALIILLLISVLVLIRKKPAFPGRKDVLKAELIFLVAFSAMAFILSRKPDILAAASEDFMDYAFLQSILHSAYLPPADPWLAGETLNYYYFGQLEAAILTVLSGIPSNITYNLAVATFFGLTASAAYGIGYNLTQRSFYGITAAVFVSISGMLSGFLQLLAYLMHSTGGFIHYAPVLSPNLLQWLYDFDFWTAVTTVIPQTFVFYPYYAFVHGNLHAQIIGFSFQLMLLLLYLGLLKDRQAGISSPLFIIAALSLGFFAGLDVWEYPAYLAVFCFVLFIKAGEKYADTGRSFKDMIKNGGIAALMSIIFYIPYYAARNSGGFLGILPVTVQRTQLPNFLEVFGLFVFIIASYLSIYYAVNRESGSTVLYAASTFFLSLVIAQVWDFQLLPLLAAIVILAACGAVKQRGRHEECFSFLLIVAGGLVALFPEVLYVVDAMPLQRFNTQMKLYLQVWFLWGVASAYGVYYVRRHMKTAYAAWTAILILLVFASLVHPIASTVSWTSGAGAKIFGNTGNGTLDGTKYMQSMHRGDYAAIQWINKNIQGTPVILEAPGEAYEYSSPIATMTGIPTVLGWKSHEIVWNYNWDKVNERESGINKIYSTKDINESLLLLKKYDVQYIYVGENELAKYETGLDKFEDERYFDRVYREYTEIYRVK
ncbi:MAG: DUF2298 domain-containing protein [Candidatus Methanoperedens sp.]|nr:DUF2298 domain-containing protein [Candidatus Methanoperedens sp.]